MKKYSFLSIALVGASAITAAFIPSKKADAKNAEGNNLLVGTLQLTTGSSDQFTCINDGDGLNCDYSITVGKPGGVSGTSAVGPLGTYTSPRIPVGTYTNTLTTIFP